MEIVFLGTGGGRWVTLFQELRTGGFILLGSANIHVDPGPGALLSLRLAGLSPLDTKGCVVSHSHPDHYSDAELVVEGMTKGMAKRGGSFIGSSSAVQGGSEFTPALGEYHSSKLEVLKSLSAGEKAKIGEVELEALPTKHSDPTAIGLKFILGENKIAYTSDTQHFEGIDSCYRGARVLIANVVRLGAKRIRWHLCTEDMIEIVQKVKPELAVMQHFGMKMLPRPEREAEKVEKASGVRTLAAKDFMKLKLQGDIEVQWGRENASSEI